MSSTIRPRPSQALSPDDRRLAEQGLTALAQVTAERDALQQRAAQAEAERDLARQERDEVRAELITARHLLLGVCR